MQKIKAIFKATRTCRYSVPLFSCMVSAGFPSPADDYIEKNLDLNEHLIKHPAATFFVRVEGSSMLNAGVHHGDILIVDRSLEPCNNRIVIAVVDGEMTVKRLRRHRDKLCLVPESDRFEAIDVTEEMGFQVWGVVTHVIHSL